MRYRIWAAVLGFLVGSAAIAGGQDDGDLDELREELARLQREAARLAQKDWELRGAPPANDAGLELGILPVEDITAPTPWFLPPSDRYLSEDDETPLFGGQAEEAPQPFGTIEELSEMVQVSIGGEVWEHASITPHAHNLVLLAPPATIGRCRELLDQKLRPRVHRNVVVDLDVVQLPWSLARSLTRGGAAVTNAQRTAIAEAIRGGDAARLTSLRAVTTPGGRSYVWHGDLVAVRSDSDVEVAQTASVSDPVVQIVQAGTLLAVAAERVGGTNRMRLDLVIRRRELGPLRSAATKQADTLDLAEWGDQEVALNLEVVSAAWTVAGAGSSGDGKHRVYLVRAIELERGGGR